jgi:non-ribosomal peptide synthetase component F/acyl carrier protein
MQKCRLVPVPTYPFARIDVRCADRPVPVEEQSEQPGDVARYGKDERPSARPLRKALSKKFGIPGGEISGNSKLQELGINSIEVISLRHELERDLGCEIPLRTFERAHSISEIELKLQQLVATHRTTIPSERDVPVPQRRPDLIPSAGLPAEFPSIVENRAERGQPFPLADIQEAFLVGRRLGGQDRVGAHLYFEFEIPKLDIHRLNAAWNRLIARHEMLRAVQLPDNQQQIRQNVPVYRIKAKDLRRHHEAERQRLMLELRQRLLTRVYDPGQWPLFDICVSICPQSVVLHFSIDEFIIDGAGIALLFEQWNRLYQTPDLDLTPLSLSFRDVVLAQKQFERSHRYRRDLEYWMSKLDGSLSGPRIPKRFYQNGTAEDRDRIRLSATLSPSEWSSLTRRAEKAGVSATVMLLTLFGEVLRAWSEEKSFALLMTYFNRLPWHEQINEVVAPFASTNIFVLGERRDHWLSELMRNHERQAWTDIDHSSVSGVRVLRELKAQRKVPGSFSLPVVFTSLIASPGAKRESAGETGGLFQMRRFYENHTPQVYLDHQVTEHDGHLEISWDVLRKHFGDASIDLMFQGYCDVLHRLSRSDTDWSVEDIEKVIEAAKSANPERFDGRSPAPVEEPASPHSPARLDLMAETEGQFEPFPLTDQQQAYAFGRSKLLIGGGNSCQCYYEFNVRQLDVKRLEDAWRKVMEAHPMLCTEVRTTGAQIRLDPVPAYSVQVVDLRELIQAERAAALAETRSTMLRVFPLGEWPYFDLRVSLIDAHTASIHFSIDLLIADGTSIAVVIQDLLRCYSDPEKPARRAAITFRDYVTALQRYRATPAYQRDLSYWERKFATLPSGPTFGLRERLVDLRGKRNRFNGRLMNWSRVKERAKQEGVSPSAVLLASFMEVLWEWNQRRPFSVVVPSWNRPPLHRDIYRVVGDFTAMSWIASCDAPESSFSEKIRAYHEVMQEGLAHQAGSGLTALRKSAAKRGRKSLVFSAVFTDLVPKVDDEALPVGFEQVDAVSQTPQVHLDSMCHDSGDTLEFYWDIQSGVYPAGMVETMFEGYRRILQYLSDHPNDWEGHLFSELIDASPARYEGQEGTEAEWIPRTENANGRSQLSGPKTELRVLS